MFHALTPQERRTLGQSRRRQISRQAHNHWQPSDRHTDPMAAIAASAIGRIPALLAIRWERMAASPFGFFRGAVAVMAADLAVLPHTGIVTQICGDAHVRNLGAYAAPDGRLVFDINDFDETIRGPFEWDLKRLATSIVLAAREAGAKNVACESAANLFLASYVRTVRNLARMPVLDVARYQVHRLQRIVPVSQTLGKAEHATPQSILERLTELPKPSAKASLHEHRVFKDSPPLQQRLSRVRARAVLDSLALYRENLLPERQHFLSQYRPLDVAFRIVGNGSVGLRDYLVYLEGNGPRDPLFLQIKEEPGSVYAPYLGAMDSSQHQGRRVAEGQRAMQLQSDLFLGWTTIQNRHYLVRQFNDHKASIDLGELQGEGLRQFAEICGELLGRGHSRSGDALVLDGYIGSSSKFGDAISAFSVEYADQTERDYRSFLRSRFVPRGTRKKIRAREKEKEANLPSRVAESTSASKKAASHH